MSTSIGSVGLTRLWSVSAATCWGRVMSLSSRALPRKCSRCGRGLISDAVYKTLSIAERQERNVHKHQGRGLCALCYDVCGRNGTLIDYERKRIPHDEVMDEWELLKGRGYSRREAAARIGVTKKALDLHIQRERKRKCVSW